MPQIFQVLRCFKCLVFQVHQTKKSKNFTCKMCGEKQSIKRHYGLGTGQECRLHVQKLNGIRGELEQLNDSIDSIKCSEDEDEKVNANPVRYNKLKGRSKWSNYVDKEEDSIEPQTSENMYLGNTEVVLEIPKKRRKFSAPKSNNKIPEIPLNKNDPEAFETEVIKPYKYKNDCQIKAETGISVVKKPIPIINTLNPPKNDTIKTFVLPQINKSSKWAQFTETENIEEVNEDFEYNLNEESNDSRDISIEEEQTKWEQFSESDFKKDTTNIPLPQTNNSVEVKTSLGKENESWKKPFNIFSTCDESDLDSILNI